MLNGGGRGHKYASGHTMDTRNHTNRGKLQERRILRRRLEGQENDTGQNEKFRRQTKGNEKQEKIGRHRLLY